MIKERIFVETTNKTRTDQLATTNIVCPFPPALSLRERGTSLAVPAANHPAGLRTRWPRFSLSRRERAGMRGKEPRNLECVRFSMHSSSHRKGAGTARPQSLTSTSKTPGDEPSPPLYALPNHQPVKQLL